LTAGGSPKSLGIRLRRLLSVKDSLLNFPRSHLHGFARFVLCGVSRFQVVKLLANKKRPRTRGLVGETVAKGRYDALPIENLPRSVFLNRASLPFVLSSLIIAEYNVAAGVLPPGEVQ
jgi:hypothetical protein